MNWFTHLGARTKPAGPPAHLAQVRVGTALSAQIPPGDPAAAWATRTDSYRLVSPLNRRHFRVVVVGTGLAGAGAAAALGELGYQVDAVTYHDSPRRAHSVAAQGGINAARARRVDGDSLHRFVTDTVKGGDFRGREAEAYRLGQESTRVIDHLNGLGVPFAREYGGSLATRSFGGVQVSRTYYSRGQTGQQLQLAATQALWRQVARGTVTLHSRTEMLDLVLAEGRAAGIIARDLVTGELTFLPAHAVVLATGGYGSIYHHSTLAVNCNATALWRAHRRGALFANPSFIQFHPTALPVSSKWQSKTILMSESLRNDGRMWVPAAPGDQRPPDQIPEAERDYFLERKYPAFGNLTPRDIASRAAAEQIGTGHGVGPLQNSVYLDFSDALDRLGQATLAERYGNLFTMYHHATGEDPTRQPMRIAPGAHFTMGGLWTDFDLMSSIPGLFVGGEAGSGYHGANRLGANSLLSACVDGWFVVPLAVPNYLAELGPTPLLTEADRPVASARQLVSEQLAALRSIGGTVGPSEYHRRLGEILTRTCGVERSEKSLATGLRQVRDLRAEFWSNLSVPGPEAGLNQTLERANRVADFLELAELMLVDAAERQESCGAHFRTEYQRGGEAQRDDRRWAGVSAWASAPLERGAPTMAPTLTQKLAPADPRPFVRHFEPLQFTDVKLSTRSYR